MEDYKEVLVCSTKRAKECKEFIDGTPHHWGKKWFKEYPVIGHPYITSEHYFIVDIDQFVDSAWSQYDPSSTPS